MRRVHIYGIGCGQIVSGPITVNHKHTVYRVRTEHGSEAIALARTITEICDNVIAFPVRYVSEMQIMEGVA